jgi:hypothetical protein
MNPETRDQLEDLALNGKIISKKTTRKRLEKTWNEFGSD